jgi:hypothetical protein
MWTGTWIQPDSRQAARAAADQPPLGGDHQRVQQADLTDAVHEIYQVAQVGAEAAVDRDVVQSQQAE